MRISFRWRTCSLFSIVRQSDFASNITSSTFTRGILLLKTPPGCFYHTQKKLAQPLRCTKPKARAATSQYFDDVKLVTVDLINFEFDNTSFEQNNNCE